MKSGLTTELGFFGGGVNNDDLKTKVLGKGIFCCPMQQLKVIKQRMIKAGIGGLFICKIIQMLTALGIKMNYASNDEKIYAAVLLLNAWQRMNISNRKFYPAFGSQVTYKPTIDFSFNCSIFLGRAEWRFFNHSSPYFLTKTGNISTNHSITSSVVIDLVK